MKECPSCRCCFPDDVLHCPEDGSETTVSITGEPILDGRYQLERRLGSGGMGVVFKARHIFLKTAHAIKIILPDLVGNDPNLVTRFRQEALAAAAIRHQNIIAVTDFGVVRGTMPFLVMEFVQGKSLQDIMAEEGAMSPVRAFELMQPICAGIAAAHRQNIVHRDLKPLNVMIQDGVPIAEGIKILDFGLAKIKSGELLGSFIAAQTTGLMGSPFYMAPEQWSDEPPDARADVYSLGVMLFQMLCGEVPFKGSSIPAIMKKHLTSDVPSLASKGIEVPPQIESVLRHALEKEPEHRTPSADEFARELREAMARASATLKRTGDAPAIDPSQTIVTPPPPQPSTSPIAQVNAPPPAQISTPPSSGSIGTSGPLAGTISSASLAEEEQKNMFAQQELAREEEARRKLAEQEQQRRAAEEQRRAEQKRQQEEAALAAEQKRVEALVTAQTKVLEDKITQLASSMAPRTTAAIDAEATQIRPPGVATVGESSFARMPTQSYAGVDAGVRGTKRSVIPIVVIVLFVLVVGSGIGGYLIYKSRSVTPASPVKPIDPLDAPVAVDLIQIPGGNFEMGRSDALQGGKDDALQIEGPAHPVSVNAFSMDKTEVTNREYAQFVRQTNHKPPEQWGNVRPPAGEEQLPVSNVSYEDAVAFAEWRSKRDGVTYRLPTEEEWEYAARNGGKNNLYPWGNTWEAGRAISQESGVIQPKPVGTTPEGADVWGVQDLMGNVYEWTSSDASLYQGSPLKLPNVQKGWKVIRGGGYGTPATSVRGTKRDWFPPTYKNPVLGFRLVKTSS